MHQLPLQFLHNSHNKELSELPPKQLYNNKRDTHESPASSLPFTTHFASIQMGSPSKLEQINI